MPELSNLRHERFCHEYLIDHNATQAAIRTGYSERSAYSTGSELLKKPEIAARVRELTDDLAQSLGITAASVMLDLRRVADACMREEPIIELNDEGEPVQTGTRRMDSAGACRALELLGKAIGLFEDRVQVSLPEGICVQYDYGDGDPPSRV